MTGWSDVFDAADAVVLSRAALLGAGATSRSLTAAVRHGHLVRLRRDHYALPQTARPVAEAVRIGGRLTCVSALHSYGVFAYDPSELHVHLPRDASRLRAPALPREPLSAWNRGGAQLHWWPVRDAQPASRFRVGLVDALAHSVRCQHPWHAIASLDNALHLGAVEEAEVDEVFRRVPVSYRAMRGLVDGRAEAGQESVLRMIVREAGLACELQCPFPGVGRVDILVERRLVLEADSRAHHNGWEAHVRDRGRDLALAGLGYPSLRPAYQHTMHHPMLVRDAIMGILDPVRGAVI